ncbi:MAG: arginine--tRNA ligase [Candidatus ainarchaeum sp.]|nr:arginine--tRNA ligase [Candidatus ainarchaeum sp.]
MNFKKELADFAEAQENEILVSPKSEMGDFCLPCFQYAKIEHKPPDVIANELKEKLFLKKNFLVDRIETIGGYLNFFLNKKMVAKKVLETKTDFDFEYKNYGIGKTVCIDYCSANLAKYLHIGHMSTTMIGESLHRIYSALGYKVVRINYLGDYGTPFGKMVVAIGLWGNIDDIKKNGIDAIQDLYVKFSSNETEELMEKARYASKCIEEKMGEEYEIYKIIIDISIKECKRIINLIGIEFDDWRGESFYDSQIEKQLREVESSGISREDSDGSVVVDLGIENLPEKVVKRSDGGSTYIIRDLCAVQDRFDRYTFDEMLYVVAVQQKLHFEQLFRICSMLNKPYASRLHHISFGMFSTPEGKIASRRGKQAIFVDIFNTALDKAKEVIKDKEFKFESKTNVAKQVALGAIAFSILKVERNKDKVFDLQSAISFDGETAPYLQYTYARCCSLLRKFDVMEKTNTGSTEKLEHIYETYFEIFKICNSFDQVILSSKEKAEPCFIARELLNLAQVFNKFYNEVKILDNDNYNLSEKLIQIVKMVKNLFEFTLPLVMVYPVSEM